MVSEQTRTVNQKLIIQITLSIAVLMLVGLVTATLSTIMGLRLGNELVRPNPFVSYEMIWPGQSMASLAMYAEHILKQPIDCTANTEPQNKYASMTIQINAQTYGSPLEKTICRMTLKDGVFRWGVITLDHEQIQQLALFSDVLNQDALFLYWGAPDIISQSTDAQYVNLTWLRTSYSALVTVDIRSLKVRLITLTLGKTA